MARISEGVRVFVDQVVIEIADKTNPPGMSRTAWINYLIQVGADNVQKPRRDAA